jgi:hypothetical protein
MDPFSRLPQHRQHRIGLVQQHVVVECFADPGLNEIADVAEIANHALFIQLAGFEANDGGGVVSMQMPAFAPMVEQAVPVAEMDFFGDCIHGADRVVFGRGRVYGLCRAVASSGVGGIGRSG